MGNMQTSLHFCVNLLGFTNASWGNHDFTHVSRDRAGIYLCLGDPGIGNFVNVAMDSSPL
jgi:hypothetical protein